MNKKVVIVHYNTPDLMLALVKSIRKFTSGFHIYIFDNSDKEPFSCSGDDITIIDNTNGQIIDFDKWEEEQDNIDQKIYNRNKLASAKHSYSIQKCIELIDGDFILLDSDVLLKKDISDIMDDRFCCVGMKEKLKERKERVLPFLCYINANKCNENNIKFFDKDRMIGINYENEGNLYDTGASFLEDIKQINAFKNIDIMQYVVHYASGSWNAPWNKGKSKNKWLNAYRRLWM